MYFALKFHLLHFTCFRCCSSSFFITANQINKWKIKAIVIQPLPGGVCGSLHIYDVFWAVCGMRTDGWWVPLTLPAPANWQVSTPSANENPQSRFGKRSTLQSLKKLLPIAYCILIFFLFLWSLLLCCSLALLEFKWHILWMRVNLVCQIELLHCHCLCAWI